MVNSTWVITGLDKTAGLEDRLIRGGRWGSDAEGKKELITINQLEKYNFTHIAALR